MGIEIYASAPRTKTAGRAKQDIEQLNESVQEFMLAQAEDPRESSLLHRRQTVADSTSQDITTPTSMKNPGPSRGIFAGRSISVRCRGRSTDSDEPVTDADLLEIFDEVTAEECEGHVPLVHAGPGFVGKATIREISADEGHLLSAFLVGAPEAGELQIAIMAADAEWA